MVSLVSFDILQLPHTVISNSEKFSNPTAWVTCTVNVRLQCREHRTAKGSTLMEDETLCPSGYINYIWFSF